VPTSALRFGTNRAPTASSAFPGSWEAPCSFWTCSPAVNLPWPFATAVTIDKIWLEIALLVA
jgi:hypothetical protein